MFKKSYEEILNEIADQPVECLGMNFPNDQARREYFLEKLREKLKDPEFRRIEGFPIGSDEDILALSDPPHYTACPNPFIADFINHYGKPYDPSKPYSREPFATDVSEGKNDPIYNAHSYHTKVPHKAIMRYILHYTEPGDIVFDGFCGTGMTGIAATLTDRIPILSDLSPVATNIANSMYALSKNPNAILAIRSILHNVRERLGWMYRTKFKDQEYDVNYIVWADVHICPECLHPSNYWDLTIRLDEGNQLSKPECPHCRALFTSTTEAKQTRKVIDKGSGKLVDEVISEPVLLSYFDGRAKRRKIPDQADFDLGKKVHDLSWPSDRKVQELPKGYNLNQPKESHKISYAHQFYTYRNFVALSSICSEVETLTDYDLRRAAFLILESILDRNSTRRNRFIVNRHNPQGRVNGPLANTLYIPSIQVEMNVFQMLEEKIRDFERVGLSRNEVPRCIITGSSSDLRFPENTVDYIFVDPPFGGNIMYSEVNFLWEYWLGVFTEDGSDATVNPGQNKDIMFYLSEMIACYKEFYRVLKPGRWITTEFHNSHNAIWTCIQEAIQRAGFIVSTVRALDKGKSGTIHQDSKANTAKTDLAITAYKPNGGLEQRFALDAGTEAGLWDFVRTHLKQLPIFISKNGQAEVIAERQNYLLFDRMVALHVQRGVTVPLSATEFYAGLAQRFSERDGMYFLPEQVAEYDKKRMTVREVLQLQLFVTDESSAIQWLKQQLIKKPQTFQELHPQFLKEIGGWQKHEKPLELSEMLEQNFLRYDGNDEVPNQIHSYLSTNFKDFRNLPKDDKSLCAKAKDRWYMPDPNKAGDLEKLRERSLLKEFEDYRASSQKRLKVFRLEAVRAGFKRAWQERDYTTIITVARKIPENVLQEDPKLLMWYDQAVTRSGEED
ncbi:MAG: DNA methyltransferase [Planctomycetota bacterium]